MSYITTNPTRSFRIYFLTLKWSMFIRLEYQTIIITIVIVDRESKISQKRISKEDKKKIAQEDK